MRLKKDGLEFQMDEETDVTSTTIDSPNADSKHSLESTNQTPINLCPRGLVRTSRACSAPSESRSQAPPDDVGLIPSAVTPARNLLDRTTALPNVINLDASIDPTARLFGERLRQLRISRQMTQTQISEATGITPAYVSLIERGKANPTLDMMVKLADAVGSEVWDMIRPEGNVSS